MGSDADQARSLLPYLQRADELQKHDPLVAYYCRLYAVDIGMQIPSKERAKDTNELIQSIIRRLEKDKKYLKLTPEDNLYLEGFASNVFAKADKQDRAGRADLGTAKTFYAASIFFDILNQFGSLPPDIEQKQKYAVWKAADIRKALKEGRKPEPGPPGGDKDAEISSYPTDIEAKYSRQPSILDQQPSGALDRQSSGISSRQLSGSIDRQPSDISSRQQQNIEAPSFTPAVARIKPVQARPVEQSPPQQQAGNFSPNFPTEPSYTDYHVSDSSNSHSQPMSNTDISDRAQLFSPNSYTVDQQQLSQSYYSAQYPIPPYTYPNFQSYPSFHDSTVPVSTVTHPSSSYNSDSSGGGDSYSSAAADSAGAADASYSAYSAPAASATNYSTPAAPATAYSAPAAPATTYSSPAAPATTYSAPTAPAMTYLQAAPYRSNVSAVLDVPAAPSVDSYRYDSNYQPPVEKIAEAHKAARFAVGALAFDDVSNAVEHLQRALELLTNPTAESR